MIDAAAALSFLAFIAFILKCTREMLLLAKISKVKTNAQSKIQGLILKPLLSVTMQSHRISSNRRLTFSRQTLRKYNVF